ncbi:MAG: arylesterase [Gammaproteobacteria bacterium]|nr:arylesterase [Gammaproteobacteria bacterium]
MKSLVAFIIGFHLMSTPALSDNFTTLIWGDSLSSGYGIPKDQAWTNLLSSRVKDSGIDIVNGSIPGEITQGGKERIHGMLSRHQPDLVVIGLGSNDGLQGLDTREMYSNLESMINACLQADAEVLLLGMKIPPNYGAAYTRSFYSVFEVLAEKYPVGFVPFFLEPAALDFDLMQDDGIHPTAEAQALLLDHIWSSLTAYFPTEFTSTYN